MRTRFYRLAGIACVVLATACGVHQTEAPSISGPSTLAQSVTITATPDSLTQNGASQSAVKVLVNGPDGRPLAGRAVHLDMTVGGALVDYGTLSTKSVVTASDGTATSIYTAPPAPPAGTAQNSGSVSIVATLIGNDAQTQVPVAADIRLVPPGVILPPAGTPTPAFRVSPTSPATNTLVLFDASPSCGGALVNNACPATADADRQLRVDVRRRRHGSGRTPSHTYTAANSYNVTLTVTNTRGGTASATSGFGRRRRPARPPTFVVLAAAPAVGQSAFQRRPVKGGRRPLDLAVQLELRRRHSGSSGLTTTPRIRAGGCLQRDSVGCWTTPARRRPRTHPVTIGIEQRRRRRSNSQVRSPLGPG